jgi:RNA polymerase sigma factor (sigma-70 family)
VEASALQAPATLSPTRVALGTPLLRFRSDEQLVALFRAGHDEAFRAIHDRYHKRLLAYARQMLPGTQDAEDALQDVFVRAYAGLRASDQELALRAWLFRVAHNRCIDELRRPVPPPPEVLELVRSAVHDPVVEVDLRETLRRLIEDIRRLPEQQRSALLMRELAGMSYADLSASLGISVGAVKSLLVRARVALAQAAEARDASCVLIREQLVEAHDRGLRPNALARKHMRDCVGCKSFRRELRGMSRQLAAVAPAVGPLGVLAKTLGFSGGAGGGAAGTGGGLALLGGGGAASSAGGLAVGVNHVATLLVAAVATAGGAVELQHAIIPASHHGARSAAVSGHHRAVPAKTPSAAAPTAIQAIARDVEATVSTAPKLAASADPPPVSHGPAAASRPMTSDAAFGGPVSGGSELSRPAKTTGGTSTTSSANKTAKSHTGSSSGCSSLVSSPAGSASATTSSSASGASGAQASTAGSTPVAAVPVNDVAQTPCAMTTAPSSGTSGSSTSTTTPSSGQTTSQSTTGGGDDSTSTSTSTGGSTPADASGSSGSSGNSATGGSGSAAK